MILNYENNDTVRVPGWAFLLLFFTFLLQLGLQINHFYVPESDFFDYAEKAKILRHLQWPESFKRPPFFSAAIAFVSVLIPGYFRELYGAELLCALAAIGAFYALYRLRKNLNPYIAFGVLWLWAQHPSTIDMAMKPKAEIITAFFILCAFALFAQGDKKAYLFASIASLTRYEGAVAIAAFFVADLLSSKHKIKTTLIATLAVLPIIVWTGLNSIDSSTSGFFTYYSGFKLEWDFIPMFLQGTFGFASGITYPLLIVLTFFISLAGVYFLYTRQRPLAIAIILYSIGFILMEMIWPFADPGYLILIVWSPILFSTVGMNGLFCTFRSKWPLAWEKIKNICMHKYFAVLAVLGSALIWFHLFSLNFREKYETAFWPIIILYLLPIAIILFKKIKVRQIALWFLATTILTIPVFYMNVKLNTNLFFTRYAKAEFNLVANWYRDHYQPGDRLLISQPNIVSYLAKIENNAAFYNLADVPELPAGSLVEWLRNHHISHVALLSYNIRKSETSAWAEWVFQKRGMASIAILQQQEIKDLSLVQKMQIGPRWAKIYQVVKEEKNER